MKIKAYNQSIKREILSSKARFASILVIIFLGVAFFAGIKSAGPDIKESINIFYNNQNLMDSKIVSTLGLTDKDLELLKDNDNILDYYATQSIDVNLINMNSVVKFFTYDSKNNDINKYTIVDGKLPENSGEIALDEKVLKDNDGLKVGDKYVIESDDKTMKSFNEKEFIIVGFVKSPMYIENESRGTTTVGKGSIDYFAVVDSRDINMDVYTEIYITFKNVQGIDTYSKEYKEKMEDNTEYLKNIYSGRSIDRVEEIKLTAKEELDKAYAEVIKGEEEIAKAETEINNGKVQLEDGKNKYENGLKEYESKIANGEKEISEGESKIEAGQAEINTQKQAMLEGESKLNEAKISLDNAKQAFINKGINPDDDISIYNDQIVGINNLKDKYSELSEDIKDTVSNTEVSIAEGKIKEWKAIIGEPTFKLDQFSDLITSLEKDPEDIALAITIADGIDADIVKLKQNITDVQNLITGVISYKQGMVEYEAQVQAMIPGKTKLEEAQSQIDASKAELTRAKEELEEGKVQGKVEFESAKKQLDESEQKLIDGQKEIDDNKQKLVEARAEIDKEAEKLNTIEGKYYFFDRNDTSGYSGVKDAISSLDNIASVFPVFFFLVAVLICLTTMTRMVEENRTEIGTLKALGYSDSVISLKFVVYAALASISGSLLGILIGCNALPRIIATAYGSLYDLPDLIVKYYPSFVIQSILISVLCTVGAALFVLRVELKNNPSTMMRPKAPKVGKKILLERITPLWRKLNFNQKVTLRNLFRYKQRMLMTVFGIAGCMAMLVTGFSLNDSNTGVIKRQFDKLWNYDAMVVFNDDITEENNTEYDKVVNEISSYENRINIHQESVTFSKENINKQTVTMYVPEVTEGFEKFILLDNRVTDEKYEISDNGIIINEKLAKLLGAAVGDEITMEDSDNNSYTVKVDKITEGYLMHSIYMSKDYYKNKLEKDAVYNAQLLNLDSNIENTEEASTKLMDCNKVINVTLTSDIRSTSEDSTGNLGVVMLVIILASGSLAFVVLYNLNNINVSERIRELSTIKVLGFYDNEVTMYILRENIILTLLGVLTGSALGKVLYSFIINTAETDNLMMIPNVYMTSYLWSALITIFFSLLVMIFMHIKLKNVDMIDALKSNE